MFYVGQEVVCIDASDCSIWGVLPLELNKVYTISKLDRGLTKFGIQIVLELVETRSPHPSGQFASGRFRPIQKKQTDISIFTALLNPINHKELV